MIIFLFLIAASLTLATFTLAYKFLIYHSPDTGPTTWLAKLIGYLVTMMTLILFFLSCYYGVEYWQKGLFEPSVQTIKAAPTIKRTPKINPFIPKATEPLIQIPKEEKTPKLDNSKSLPV